MSEGAVAAAQGRNYVVVSADTHASPDSLDHFLSYVDPAHREAVAAFRLGLDAGGGATFEAHARGSRMRENSCAGSLRVDEPSFGRGLLRSQRATETAVAANFSLIAANDVAGHGVHMPAEGAQPAIEHRFSGGNGVVVEVDV